MTLSETLKNAVYFLKKRNIENAESEALWILEDVLGCSYSHILLNGNEEIDQSKFTEFNEKIERRSSGVPVQYIIGTWEFYGNEFSVGEGVLIPRPETELLVDYALDYLSDKNSPVVIDLCAGTGCIGLTVAMARPDSTVYLVEKYDEAFTYLRRNAENLKNVRIIKGDVLNGLDILELPEADLVLSNPPYICTDEIPTLQNEVLKEPVTALDGGRDGLDFYHAIANQLKFICKGAFATECGDGQAESVCSLFGSCRVINDSAGIGRVVIYEGDYK